MQLKSQFRRECLNIDVVNCARSARSFFIKFPQKMIVTTDQDRHCINVLHLNTYDSRGAGRAAYRLSQGLQSIGADSRMLVQAKSNDDYRIIAPQTKFEKAIARVRPSLSRLPLKLYQRRESNDFYPSWLADTVYKQVRLIQPNIINLHWLCDGFLEIKSLAKFEQPLVWTLHDMWSFTGGCHYTQECNHYVKSCGNCPQLGSNVSQDLSQWQWKHKAQVFGALNLTIVSPSRWLADCAQSSSLLRNKRIEVIPNGIDSKRYRPIDRQIARQLFHLPKDKHLILFGAMQATQDKRKGFSLLQGALNELSCTTWRDQIELVVFGASAPQEPLDLGFKIHYLGRISDDITLALAYAAGDVFVAPSVEDNLPNTVMEAIACGTPCVAFDIGGMPDMIEHQKNGFLAKPYQSQDLAQGIVWIIENQERHQKLCHYARQKVESEFTLQIQANRYFNLYKEILS